MRALLALLLLVALNTSAQIPANAIGHVTNGMLASGAYVIGVFGASCTGTASSGSTVYLPGWGSTVTACTGTTRTGGMPMPACTAKNLRYNASANGKSNDKITLEVAGSASALTCTFGTGSSCSDTTHAVSITAGQVVTLALTTGATETLANPAVSFECWNP